MIIIVNNSLSDYSRNKKIYNSLLKLDNVRILKFSKKYKPYKKTVVLNFFKVLYDLLTIKIPQNTNYVFVLFGDAEQLWSVYLLRKIRGYHYKIVFDPLISYYDTYFYNKPSKYLDFFIIRIFFLKWLYFYEKVLFRLTDKVLIDTDANAKYINGLFNFKINFQKILICANNKVFFPTKLKDNIFWNAKNLNVLWYGSVSKLHGVDVILRTIDLTNEANIKFTIIGNLDSFDRRLIRKLINNKKLSYIKIKLQNMALKDIFKIIQKSHICLGCFGETKKAEVVVTNKEYEALASGRCLITRTGNKEFLENNRNCFQIKPNNPEELANKILKLNKNRKLIRTVAMNASKDYKKYCTQNYNKLKNIIN